MVTTPYIKIPDVRVGGIDPTSDFALAHSGGDMQPPSLTYLTQWKIVGNSEVHGNEIWSCGEYNATDGKWHILVQPQGGSIADIALDEPLRKVNDVADSIEFANGVATVTRKIASEDMGNVSYTYRGDFTNPVFQVQINERAVGRTNVLSSLYITSSASAPASLNNMETMGHWSVAVVYFRNDAYTDPATFKVAMKGVELIYELATPTTEVIQVSPFPISPTDTYTSANDTPYSAFEYKKNVEIWSCGEYNPIDGKYHILVQPQGGSIADIALDEPLRKVNDVADSIEFADGAAVVTRNIVSIDMSTLRWFARYISAKDLYRYAAAAPNNIKPTSDSYIAANMLCAIYTTQPVAYMWNADREGIGFGKAVDPTIYVYDSNYDGVDMLNAFVEHLQGVELIYEVTTPTTETIQVPQIEEADSYSCVISQGGKAVSWSDFETE